MSCSIFNWPCRYTEFRNVFATRQTRPTVQLYAVDRAARGHFVADSFELRAPDVAVVGLSTRRDRAANGSDDVCDIRATWIMIVEGHECADINWWPSGRRRSDRSRCRTVNLMVLGSAIRCGAVRARAGVRSRYPMKWRKQSVPFGYSNRARPVLIVWKSHNGRPTVHCICRDWRAFLTYKTRTIRFARTVATSRDVGFYSNSVNCSIVSNQFAWSLQLEVESPIKS